MFVIAPLLILIFAVALHWLPAGDWVRGSLSHLLLPVVALALPYIAYVARLMRGSALEVLASPFIRTARAKGLPAHLIVLRHALRPILTPLVSFLGPAIAGVITGSIVVESVFGLPGIGRYFVTGALNRDYTLVMGITVLYGALIIAVQSAGGSVLCLDRPAGAPDMTASGAWRGGGCSRTDVAMAAALVLLLVALDVPDRAAIVAVRLLHAALDADLARTDARRRPPARHRSARARSADPRAVGLPHLARDRACGQPRERPHRRRLGRDRRLRSAAPSTRS